MKRAVGLDVRGPMGTSENTTKAAGGAFLPVSLCLRGKKAVVIGNNDEASDKIARLVRAGACVFLFDPGPLRQDLETLAIEQKIHWFARRWDELDLSGARVVVLCEQNRSDAQALWRVRRRYGFWLSAIDQPEYCDFAQVAVAEAGPVQIAFSSGGRAPALLKRMREALALAMDDKFVEFARYLSDLRAALTEASSVQRRAKLNEALRDFQMIVQFRYPAKNTRNTPDIVRDDDGRDGQASS